MNAERDDVQLAVLTAQFEAHQQSMETFQADMRAAVAGITDRLDRKINGRLDHQAAMLTEHAQLIAGLAEKASNLAHEVFSRPRKSAAVASDQKPGITQRDLKVAGFMLAAGAALVEYGPKVLKALLAIGATP